MPEQANSTALVPIDGEYQIDIKEFDAAGRSSIFRVPVPSNVNAREANAVLRAAILKRTSWKASDFPTILHAVFYADNMGLDIMAGDVYSVDGGRIATTAGAKIRHAMSTGRINGYDVQIEEGAQVEIHYEVKGAKKTYVGPELTAKVTVYVKGWEKPMTYTAKLSEWFNGVNPNWRGRPAYMLRRNALSKALEEVAPMGSEADEVPGGES